MLSNNLQIAILLAVFLYFIVLISLLRKKTLSLKYTLLWLFSGVLMLLIAVFPQILGITTSILGIQIPTNALFAVTSFCGIMIMISLTAIVSKQTERIKRLTQTLAMLEKRVRELENSNKTTDTPSQ